MQPIKDIRTIAFDADDTLWINESHFQDIEAEYCKLLSCYMPAEELSKELFKTEMQNIGIYGYGIKSFTLSMIETALRVSDNKIDAESISRIIGYGKHLLEMPVELLPGVEDLLKILHGKYRLVVATKGDLLDQERKLNRSGLQDYFHHVEIMSDKRTSDYRKLLKQLNCLPQHFLMIGNSLKSDIIPVLETGGYAAHVPFHVTWAHETIEEELNHTHFIQLNKIKDVLEYL